MGCDWRELTWWEYTARAHHWNAEGDGPPPVSDNLRKLMEARGGGHC